MDAERVRYHHHVKTAKRAKRAAHARHAATAKTAAAARTARTVSQAGHAKPYHRPKPKPTGSFAAKTVQPKLGR